MTTITRDAVLDPTGTGNFQGVFPGDAGAWYVTRDDAGDAVIDRHDAKGVFRDSCRLVGAGHVTATNIYQGLLVTTHAGDLVTVPYVAGATLDRDDVRVILEAPEGSELQVSLSPTLSRAVVRERKGGRSYFRRYVTDELLGAPASGVPARELEAGVSGVAGASVDPTRVEQSFGVVNTSVFLAYGEVGKRNWLEQWSLTTGLKVGGDLDLTKFGADVVSGFHELEYAPGRYVLAKVGTGSARRLVIGHHDLPSEV
jgi:hypothetical protein